MSEQRDFSNIDPVSGKKIGEGLAGPGRHKRRFDTLTDLRYEAGKYIKKLERGTVNPDRARCILSFMNLLKDIMMDWDSQERLAELEDRYAKLAARLNQPTT